MSETRIGASLTSLTPALSYRERGISEEAAT
jgi:hypothetical protein